jgi:hypothetical protein
LTGRAAYDQEIHRSDDGNHGNDRQGGKECPAIELQPLPPCVALHSTTSQSVPIRSLISLLDLNALSDTKASRPGSPIGSHLFGRRTYRLARDGAQARSVLATAYRDFRRADAIPTFSSVELLNETVLQGMETDDRKPPSWRKHLNRLWQGLRELVELPIHGNAKRLECPRRRVDSSSSRRHCSLHYFCERPG